MMKRKEKREKRIKKRVKTPSHQLTLIRDWISLLKTDKIVLHFFSCGKTQRAAARADRPIKDYKRSSCKLFLNSKKLTFR